MPKNQSTRGVNRRTFLTAVAATGAATGLTGAAPATGASVEVAQSRPKLKPPSAKMIAMEVGKPMEAESPFIRRAGSDFMVDVIKSLNIDYVSTMPGSSFRGLHESIVNYGGNRKPELLTCLHEETAVGIAQGYAKVAGKPMGVFLHGTVGLQHATMAIYNAWVDRVPIVIIAGNTIDATKRRPGVEWAHSVQDAGALVRDMTKWDDLPISLQHFGESLVRSYKIATTPPMGPVLIVADSELQEGETDGEKPKIPRLAMTTPPQGDSAAVAEAAKLLVGAERPVIVADRAARTPRGMALLVELAETLSAPVVDQLGRMNFPTNHELNHSSRRQALIHDADVVLGLELWDFWGTVKNVRDVTHRDERDIAKPSAKLISIGVEDLYLKSNYQDFERYEGVDLAIGGDAEATLPALIEAVRRNITADRKSQLEKRRAQLRDAYHKMREQARQAAVYGWNASPVTTARLCAELWEQIKSDDWALVSRASNQSNWPHRLWSFDKHYQFIGGPGGAGVGYGSPGAVGGALAHREHGRLSLAVIGDGDLMCAPGTLWTATHHRIPLLTIIHNNRAYHQEVMHLQRMANRRQRGIQQVKIGTAIEAPDLDYAKLAQSMGMWSSGPISDPNNLAGALKRAIQVVKSGEPALIDVVSQPR